MAHGTPNGNWPTRNVGVRTNENKPKTSCTTKVGLTGGVDTPKTEDIGFIASTQWLLYLLKENTNTQAVSSKCLCQLRQQHPPGQ